MRGRLLDSEVEVEGQPDDGFGEGSRFEKRDQLWKMFAVFFLFRQEDVKTGDEKIEIALKRMNVWIREDSYN